MASDRIADAIDRLHASAVLLTGDDRAVEGIVAALEAISENRAGTLFVDIDRCRDDPHVDAIVRAALAHGVRIVVGSDFDLRLGIAALLRIPYD